MLSNGTRPTETETVSITVAVMIWFINNNEASYTALAMGGSYALAATGLGISNVIMTRTDSQGKVKAARTTAFGCYRFDNVAAGETYILTAQGKRYALTQWLQIINVNQNIFDVNSTGSDAEKLSRRSRK